MLANARVLGYVFNPLTVFWCYDRADGTLACVVAEVHNTYGDRHCYLLHPDDRGRAERAEGVLRLAVLRRSTARYQMSLPEPGRPAGPAHRARPPRTGTRSRVQRARPGASRPPRGR